MAHDPSTSARTDCPLCRRTPGDDGGGTIFANDLLRVVAFEDADYPGFTRVVVHEHVKEMTDLDAAQLARVMATVYAVEDALRAVLAPDKVNVASLGNQVPHLHWHVIPRYRDDAHFPQPIWGARQREPDAATLAQRRALVPAVAQQIRSRIGGSG